jgi:hypothetical protein
VNNLSHDEAFPELAAVALDSAPVEFSATVREHAATCPECGPALFALEDAVAQLGQLVPQRAMNLGHGAGIRSRLLMRARAEREARSAAAPGPPDLARGVASLTGLGQKLSPGFSRKVKTLQWRPVRAAATGLHSLSQRAVDAEVKKSLPQQNPRFALFSGARLVALAASVAFIVTAVQLARVTSDRNVMRTERVATKSATRRGRMFWNRASND